MCHSYRHSKSCTCAVPAKPPPENCCSFILTHCSRARAFLGSVTCLCVVCVCEHCQARVKCALLVFDHYSTACARSVQTCQQNNCGHVLQRQLGGVPEHGVPSWSHEFTWEGAWLTDSPTSNWIHGLYCIDLHLSGLSRLITVWHFPDCASSSGFSKLSAAVFSCLVCSVVHNTQIGTNNSLLIQIGKFGISHAKWSCSLPHNSPLGLASCVSWWILVAVVQVVHLLPGRASCKIPCCGLTWVQLEETFLVSS